jgi:hypothetical protein
VAVLGIRDSGLGTRTRFSVLGSRFSSAGLLYASDPSATTVRSAMIVSCGFTPECRGEERSVGDVEAAHSVALS